MGKINENRKAIIDVWLPIEYLPEGIEVMLALPSYDSDGLVAYRVYGKKKVVQRGFFKKRFEDIFVHAHYPHKELSFKPTCFKYVGWDGIEKYVSKTD